ncbi:GNAT family N-acetyltransferase [Streptomyces sp. NRRL B-1347]|uniref:GNAT family N-acetyltransferase n=1 Tax=Streptomyces sp. NRRL B-1347 TaxID=1476877 RepID=UPI00068CCE6E|nr:GNAT family N-acetyltransferase [Streptomyces sp. NRRL B-1347]
MERTPSTAQPPPVRLVPYGKDDLPQLVRHNSPEMTAHLGGPEAEEKLRDRHHRYLHLNGTGRMFKIVTTDTEEPAGLVGFWEAIHSGHTVWETGWGVLPEFQGRGIAVTATRLVVGEARAAGRHPTLYAFPAATNGPSNAVCRKVGFTLVGAGDFEYPKGRWSRCNDWALDLTGGAPRQPRTG